MRKHPLIALTAFTALGASAIAGSTTGSFNSVLTSATSAGHHSVSTHAAPQRASMRAEYPALVPEPKLSLNGSLEVIVGLRDAHLVDRTTLGAGPGVTSVIAPQHLVVTKTAAVAPTPPAVPVVTTPAPVPVAPAGGAWYELRLCESGDNYAEDTGNGYYGAYQFSLSTWYGLGYSGLPSEASPAEQDRAAAELQARSGWGQWPSCAAGLGLY
ncbi:MAG: transglycosylase family protein [Acidimicrobiales bacterium]|jgi:hypothetical protein